MSDKLTRPAPGFARGDGSLGTKERDPARSGVPTPGVYGQFSRGLLTVTFRHPTPYSLVYAYRSIVVESIGAKYRSWMSYRRAWIEVGVR